VVGEDPRNLDSILRIPVLVQVVLGSATMPVANLMKLGRAEHDLHQDRDAQDRIEVARVLAHRNARLWGALAWPSTTGSASRSTSWSTVG
jgi:hypothetical protein